MQKNNILLVEDDNLLRIGLKSMLGLQDDLFISADVATGRDAIQAFGKTRPDIVLLDLRLPDMTGTEVLKKIRELDSSAKVVILTSCNSNEMLFESLEYGTDAYVLKGENPDELLLAIKYALNNELFISPRLAKYIIKDYLFATKQRNNFPNLHGLTAREIQIVKLIVDGHKSREIADILSISVKTVDKHRSNILQKLGAHSFNELRQGGAYYLNLPSEN